MTERKANVLRINAYDRYGGADRTARNLHRACKERAGNTWYFVGRKSGNDPDMVELPNEAYRSPWTKGCLKMRNVARSTGLERLAHVFESVTEPRRRLEKRLGIEDYEAPATKHLLDLTSGRPDLIHLHNLHGRYFDLRCLPSLSQQLPVILTLHDPWLLTGGCLHPMDCERWKSGCGPCPQRDRIFRGRRDGSAYNWRRKKKLFAQSNIYLASASNWMIERAHDSILKPAIIESRVIPNGVDRRVFCPGPKDQARREIGVRPEDRLLLFAASHAEANPFKDYRTIERAVAALSQRLPNERILLMVLGSEAATRYVEKAEVRFIPFVHDSDTMAVYYRAADLYVHAAKAELFGNVLTEALSCGTPVVATAIGGIPEIVDHGVTGLLTPPSDVEAFTSAIERLLVGEDERNAMAERGVEAMQNRFELQQQTEKYLLWYDEIAEQHRSQS